MGATGRARARRGTGALWQISINDHKGQTVLIASRGEEDGTGEGRERGRERERKG